MARISPGALSSGARCDGPTSTSACWPTVLPSGIVALRGRLTHGPRSPAARRATALMKTEKPFFGDGAFGVVLDGYQPPTPERNTPESRAVSRHDILSGAPLLLLH